MAYRALKVMRALPLLGGMVLLGAAASLVFEPWNLWWLAIAALVLLFYMARIKGRSRDAATMAALFGFGLNAISLSWISDAFAFQQAMPSAFGPLAVALLSAYLAIYWAAAVGLAHMIGKRNPISFAFAAAGLFILGEWLRGILFTGFGWNPLGAIWLPFPLISRTAAEIGALGLSGLTILFAGLLAAMAQRGVGAALALLTLMVGGLALTPRENARADTNQDIMLVQGNVDQLDKWRPGMTRQQTEHYLALSRHRASHSSPLLIFWPEAAITAPLDRRPDLRSLLAGTLDSDDLLITGSIGTLDSGQPANSVFAVNGAGTILGRYDKRHLVPFGEYLPARDLLSSLGLTRLVLGSSDLFPGAEPNQLTVGGLKAEVAICYEVSFAAEVAQRGDRPAFLFNPSNDAWFGFQGPPQHLAQARLRAIELGLPVIRATQTGISAVIRPDGSIAASIPQHRAIPLLAKMPASLAPTPYSRFSDLIPLSVALLMLAVALCVRGTSPASMSAIVSQGRRRGWPVRRQPDHAN